MIEGTTKVRSPLILRISKKITKFYLFLFLLLVRSSIDDKMYIETYLLNDLENNIVNKP